MTSPRKTLLCRPRAGFNDCLNQIERCWRYAETHGRELIVDSTRKAFCDHFGRYFEPLDPHADVRFRLDRKSRRALDRLTTRPVELSGRIGRYESKRDGKLRAYADASSGVPTTFDFEVAHDEELLVHESSGGRKSGADCLLRLRFTAPVAAKIQARLSRFPPRYVAIHVRNSDIRTDYHALFEDLRSETRGESLLICSDDPECKAFAKRFFDEANVFEATETPHYSGRAFHLDDGLKRKLGTASVNLQTLTDLMALGEAERLYYGDVASRRSPSGFSLLAADVQSRKGLVETLLSNAGAAANATRDGASRRFWSFARRHGRSR